ncbi:sulfatase [Pedobacter frigiditerrae]|uniref:sulfatase family protein n=1 Tax=Pedobacter frigiditerrae TaxID=2530452 RepID=UPI00292E0276|nr:sulfatase [Pedobacter frigiditerrae]
MKYLVIFLFLFTQASLAQRSATKPNVIIINMDDMGYGDTEPYGMTGIATPNFNKMAQEGMRLTHFNAAQAVCSPSRAALLTGTYPNRLGLAGALMPWAEIALNPAEETIASLLKKNGYTTGMLGKWHLGSKAPYFPIHYGFDSFYGIPYSHDMWPVDYDGNPAKAGTPQFKYPVLPILEGDKTIGNIQNLAEQGEFGGKLTKRAVDFIAKNQQKPFFLYFAQPMPHVPLAASAKFKGKSGIGLFGDVIMELDWTIGEIIKTLDQYKLSENTILIVTSDNGPWLRFGNHAGSSGGFREGKGTTWEGGTRVPCFIRWKGKVQAGSIFSGLLTNMDILPTVMKLSGSTLPKERIDGIDFSSVLLGKTIKSPRDVFYYYYDTNNLKAVRYQNWKLVLPHATQSYVAGVLGKDGQNGTTPVINVPMALYDLAHDPGETYDVQNQYPEMVKKIMVYVEQARADLGDDLTKNKGANRRKPAVVNK